MEESVSNEDKILAEFSSNLRYFGFLKLIKFYVIFHTVTGSFLVSL